MYYVISTEFVVPLNKYTIVKDLHFHFWEILKAFNFILQTWSLY